MTFRYSRWSMPIFILTEDHDEQSIQSPYEALELMQRDWSFSSGIQCQKARRILLSALHGNVGVEEAREAFFAAAIEAGRVIVHPSRAVQSGTAVA